MSQQVPEIHFHAAVFAINRAAKQTRDRTRRAYLYGLKERGVAYLYKNKRLDVRSHNDAYVYRGEGYAFHLDECFADINETLLEAPPVQEFVGDKPKGSFCSLNDALRILEALPSVHQIFAEVA